VDARQIDQFDFREVPGNELGRPVPGAVINNNGGKLLKGLISQSLQTILNEFFAIPIYDDDSYGFQQSWSRGDMPNEEKMQ
jgi:hypothetical protein